MPSVITFFSCHGLSFALNFLTVAKRAVKERCARFAAMMMRHLSFSGEHFRHQNFHEADIKQNVQDEKIAPRRKLQKALK